MKKVFVFLIGVTMMISCSKDQNMNITMTTNNSGNVTVRLADSTGKALSNIDIQLLVVSGSSHSTLADQITDGNGNASFNNILEGGYSLYIKKVSVGTKSYAINQAIQVVSGKTNSITINPQTYAGSIQFTFTNTTVTPYTPIPNNTVILYNMTDYTSLGSNPTTNSIIAIAFATGTTDYNGKVTFQGVPAGIEVGYMIYNSTQKYVMPSYNYYFLNKGDADIQTISINSYNWTSL